MSRGGRLVAAAVAAALMGAGAAGCGPLDAKPQQVASPATAAGCVVGSWKQTEGWQRITADTLVTDLRLISGGRAFEVKPGGTASFNYLNPTKWKNASFRDKLEVVYSGSVTLSYTAADGNWSETADASESSTQITLNGRANPATPGAASRVTKATYVCGETDLILTGDAFRQAFKRV